MPPRKLRCWLCLNGLGRSTGVVAHMLRVQQVAALVAKALLDLLGDSGAPSPAPCTRWPLRNPARLAQARSCLWCSTIFSIIGAQGRSALKSVRARCKRRHQPLALTFAFCVLRFAHKGRTRLLPLRYCDSSTLKSPKLCSSSVFCRCYTPASRAALPVRSHALGPAARPAWLLGPTPHFFDQAVFGIGCSFQIPGCILYCRQQRGHAASDLRMPTQPGKNLFVAARLCLHCAAPISWNGHALRCIGLNRTRPFANFGE